MDRGEIDEFRLSPGGPVAAANAESLGLASETLAVAEDPLRKAEEAEFAVPGLVGM
jgi:predicted naringenin-chalcone synthase